MMKLFRMNVHFFFLFSLSVYSHEICLSLPDALIDFIARNIVYPEAMLPFLQILFLRTD